MAGTQKTYATHLVGGYMSYEFLRTEANNDKTFKISLTLFRDIEQSEVEFDEEIEIGVYLNNAKRSRNQLLSVKLLRRQIVRPPGSEECDYYSNKRIEMGYYERTVTLAPYPQGYHIYFVRCCRNIQDNLKLDSKGDPYQGQTYYGFIPNPALENSSPFFSGIPSPYMCNNDTNTFLNRAVDPDGDSLVYRFVHPFQGGSVGQSTSKPTPPKELFPDNTELIIPKVEYKNTSFNVLNPFSPDGYANVDRSNGLTTLMARKPGSYVIAIEVEEYRNGISLGTVRLDMQILVLDCPPNKKPIGSNEGGTYFEIEAGEELCFKVFGNDPDVSPPQDVTVFATGDIMTGENGVTAPLAKMERKKARSSVETEFCWTPSCDQARDEPYEVTISTQDNGCPPKYHNYNIEIKVNRFEGSDEIVGPQRVCAASSYEYIYDAKDPQPNSTFYWEATNATIVGDNDQASVTLNFNGTGSATIRMVEISQYGCTGDTIDYVVDLIPTPALPVIAGTDTVCLGALNVNYTTTNNTGSTYRWILPDGSFGGSTTASIDQSWPQLGDFTLSVVETNSDGCRSDTGKIVVNVRKPDPGLYGAVSLCPNAQGIAYTATGHPYSTYNWTVNGGVQAGGGNSSNITVNWGNEGLGSIEIVETDKWGCRSDVVTIPIEKTYNLKGAQPGIDTSVCEFDTRVPYFVVNSNGSVYRWSVTGGTQVSGDSTSNIEVNWGAAGAGVIGVQQRAFDAVNNRECLSPILTLDVTIHPNPTANEINGDFSFCQGEDVRTYTVNGFAGSTYEWTVNGSNQDINGQGTNEIRLRWPDHGSFTMTVREMSKDSCFGELIDTVVIVHPKPISNAIEGDFIRCFPDISQTLYRVSGYPNSTYTWNVSNGTMAPPSTADSLLVDWNDQGHGEISVVEVSEFGCVGDTIKLPVYINNIELDLDRVSVGFPDDQMVGEWRTLYDDQTSEPFTVEKRAFGVEVTWSSVSNEHTPKFHETGINTDLTPFEYQIKTTDLCGNERFSEIHRSVLLTGVQDPNNFSLNLNFTPYIGWDNGVSSYELYRSSNADKSLSFFQMVSEGENIVIPSNNKDYRQCFRVLAHEAGGQTKSSWSNEICFFFSPNVYVPTAFSPKNNDGLNDQFHPVSVAVKDYQMKIFNRWGEIIFETDQQEEGWDGTYQQVDSPSGIYMYLITFSDFNDEVYQKAGTIQLMR
ncbi:MAG: gliding motility-associated C-terminal domain-containing protein [Bacteroidia bacterium]|nr:gliding motility-associated C-terminal domain-containing protein [Bacteroidia bacterium]